MKWVCYLALSFGALTLPTPTLSQSATFTLPLNQTVSLPYSGVTAAFARNPRVASVSLGSDLVTVQALRAGATEIVIFIGSSQLEKLLIRCGSLDPAGSQPQATRTVNVSFKDDDHAGTQSLSSRDSLQILNSISDVAPSLHGFVTESSLTPIVSLTEKPISILETRQLLLPVAQMRAAYSLDPAIAEAQMLDGQLRISGRAPGRALIVLVANDFSTASVQVNVTPAPPIVPEQSPDGLSPATRESSGSYELRVASSPFQVADVLDYQTSRLQLHLSDAISPARDVPGLSPVWFPNTYLKIRGDQWKLTLLDDQVDSSPISVNSTLLRGLHFSDGDFVFHAGYTSAAGFQTLFLPVQRQVISGFAFAHHLNPFLELGATGYYVQRDGAAIDRQVAQGLATLFFRYRIPQAFEFSSELGISKGLGGAVTLARESTATQFHLDARYRPKQYAVSDTDNLGGLQSNLLWNRIWSKSLISAVSGSANHIFTQTGAQTIEVANANLTYKLNGGFSASAGSSVSHFSENPAAFPDIRRFAAPLIFSYDRKKFGLSAQYEYSRTSNAFAPGHGYRGSARWNGKHVHFAVNAGLDTQSLGIDSVFSLFPDLDVALARLGFSASIDPEQLAVLLNNRAFLNSLGLAPSAVVQLVPRNWEAGVTLSWQGARQAFELNSNYNLNSFLTQRNSTFLQTALYRRSLSRSTEFIASFTILESIAPTHRWEPVWELGLRHQFEKSSFPSWRKSKGAISGTVRVRDSSGDHPLPGAPIRLDNDRRVISDAEGRYQFSGVPAGVHTVEIVFESARPFWFSTPSTVATPIDAVVDFGIVYPSAEILGYVRDDTGTGMVGIGVRVRGPHGELNLNTDQSGKFAAPITELGEYTLHVNAETVPDGYLLENLELPPVKVSEGESQKASFSLAAIRALTGTVQTYDRKLGGYRPLVGVTVQLAELGLSRVTDSDGRYLFRNLPSGLFAIRVNGQDSGRVELSAAPQLLRHDIHVTTDDFPTFSTDIRATP